MSSDSTVVDIMGFAFNSLPPTTMNTLDIITDGFKHGLPLCDRLMYNNMTDGQLAREYLDLTKHTFHPVCCNNAKSARNFAAMLLLNRGHTQIANLFGPIKISIIRN